MTEAKLAPNLPGWMVEHANRYLSSGGADGHMYKMTQPDRPEVGREVYLPPVLRANRRWLYRGRLERRRTATPRLVPQHPRQPGRRSAGRDRKDEGAGENRHRRGARPAVEKGAGVLAAL